MHQRRQATPLDAPAQFLKGVGPKRAEALARLDIHTGRDLLYHAPRRYEDASTVTPIVKAEIGLDVTIIGEVVSKGVIPTRAGLRIFQAVLKDGTGRIEVSWPGQPFLDRSINKGDILLVTGSVRFFHGRVIQPREFIVLGNAEEQGENKGKVLPIYPATEGLSQRMLRNIVDANVPQLIAAADVDEVFDARTLKDIELPPLQTALQWVHQPETLEEAHRGRRRLAYDEVFFLQLLHARAHHHATRAKPGITFHRNDRLVGALYKQLPFVLTGAQTRALQEIFGDMTGSQRMNRLLQGDVGSGKTVVALFAMLLAVENGYQAALMAPTEILAEQHARTMRQLLGDLPVKSVLLTGRMSAGEKRAATAAMGDGSAPIVIGTHALIQEHISFHKLGLAVIDEQHRFGVRQRLALSELGDAADTLVMSATPIPRSLALTIYGDLDLSVLDELPPGRQRVRTALRDSKSRGRVYDFIREEVQKGRQAYIVYPLVEESEKVDLKAATAEYKKLSQEIFADLRVGLLHGQLSGDDKDVTMRAFAAGEIDILVATTVIEVGIDVANASVMVIEHAERFGLSQLHQLRGRVGRGADQSYCILIWEGGEEALGRLRIFEQSDDGFEIARADLQLRGMGDFFGARQHGLPEFRFFDVALDEDLLARARNAAREIVARDADLSASENALIRAQLERRYGARARLYEVG
ncbi:MAG TPA: ATP-dependent DNA helicase RecG [Longimicrobiales bacterium]|nr:ATP-dependent DNA helicase RecG [Longimicrobiales bacterium]